MAPTRILPVRTTDRVMYALTPDGDGHVWQPVRVAGEHITATVRPLSYLEAREVQDIEDPRARLDRILELGWVSGSFEGQLVALDEVPFLHRFKLAEAVFELSAVGADPFGRAPAASSR